VSLGVVTIGGMSLTISCDDCAMLHTEVCEDCVVTFLCGPESSDGVVIDAAEAKAIRLLSSVGLAADLRHARRAG